MTSFRYPVAQPYTGQREMQSLMECVRRNQFSHGPTVREFERAFADWVGTKHALATMNGTVALHLALLAHDIGPGDEVIVPSLTYVATANAVRYCGAEPVFVDVSPTTWTMDPMHVADAVTKQTRAILPVHLYGHMADIDQLWDLVLAMQQANGQDIWVVEDAAEAHGATWRNPRTNEVFRAGFIGDVGVFSFFGNKILTCGEGGMVTTDDDDAFARMTLLRGQGMDPQRRYYHPEMGFNYRMTEMQAALGLAQLEDAAAHITARRQISLWYRMRLGDAVQFQHAQDGYEPVWWMTTVLLPDTVNRSYVTARLDLHGVETRPAFAPVHTFPMYATGQTLPVTQRIADHGLSLPSYRGLTEDDVEYICTRLLDILRDGGSQ